MPIKDVQVTITRETRAVTRAGFGLPLIIGTAGAQDYALCSTLAEVADAGHAEASEVYKIASRIFAQTPRPPRVAVVGFADDTSLESDLNTLVQEYDDWYFLLADTQTAANIDTLAAWAAANKKLYFVSMDTADLAGDLAAGTLELDRAVVLCHKQAATEYPAEGWVGVCAPQDPGSVTWKFKTISGVSVSGYSPTEIEAIKDDGGNVVESQGGVLHTTEGTALDGTFIDIVRSQDFMEARIKENIFFILANAGKVPYTDAGISQIVGGLESALMECFNNEIIADDEGGEPMYTIDYPTREEVPAPDRANRLLPDIYFVVTLAGAVHSVEIAGVLQI